MLSEVSPGAGVALAVSAPGFLLEVILPESEKLVNTQENKQNVYVEQKKKLYEPAVIMQDRQVNALTRTCCCCRDGSALRIIHIDIDAWDVCVGDTGADVGDDGGGGGDHVGGVVEL